MRIQKLLSVCHVLIRNEYWLSLLTSKSVVFPLHRDTCFYRPPTKSPPARKDRSLEAHKFHPEEQPQRTKGQGSEGKAIHKLRPTAALSCRSALICGIPEGPSKERTSHGTGASSAPQCPTLDQTERVALQLEQALGMGAEPQHTLPVGV